MANPVIYIRDSDTSTARIANNLFVKTGIITPQAETKEVDIENLDVMNNPGIGMSNAVVLGVSKYMEATILGFISSGMTNLLQSMGINEETMSIAQQVLNIADNSITLVSSIIKSTPSDVYMIPSGNSVPAAICASLRDMFDAMIISLKELIVEEWNNMVTNLPNLILILHDLVEILVNQAIDMINALIEKYLGFNLELLYKMVLPYIAKYKLYRRLKKELDKPSEDGDEETKSGYSAKMSVNVKVDSKKIKQLLMDELADCSDLIYNAFIIVLIKDTIDLINEIVKLFTDADVSTLTDNISSFEDVMDLLVEMGLGNDETSLVLSLNETIKSSINSFQKNALQLIGAIGAQAVQSGYNMAKSTINNTTITPHIDIYHSYDFVADPENMCIVMYVYDNPTKKLFKKLLYKTLSEKDENGKQFISNADITKFFDTVVAGYNSDRSDLKIEINNKQYIIKYEIQESSEEEEPEDEEEIQIGDEIELGIVTEVYTVDPLAKRKRPTLQLAHELFAILKEFFPILKVIVKLISNYKINKEKVKNHALGNLYAMARIIANIKGLNKKVNINNVNFYTVRTLEFYDFLILENICNKQNNSPEILIDYTQTYQIRKWLKEKNEEYRSLNIKLPTLLYIDNDALNILKNIIDNQINDISEYIDDPDIFIKYPDIKYHNGDVVGLDTVEYIGDEVYYSDSSLPIYGSLILRAIGKN